MDTREYWLERDNDAMEGPYGLEELRDMLRQGQCSASSLVISSDSGDTTPLGDLLSAAAPAKAPSAQPGAHSADASPQPVHSTTQGDDPAEQAQQTREVQPSSSDTSTQKRERMHGKFLPWVVSAVLLACGGVAYLCSQLDDLISSSLPYSDDLVKRANAGDAYAQHNLGWCYENGSGVTKDAAEAAKWYRKAAVQGYAPAQNNLGVCYKYGRGVRKDAAEAVKWYRKAAEQGNESAKNALQQVRAQQTRNATP